MNTRAATSPLYETIKQWVRDQIASGAFAPGHRVPSENELAERFGVARMTANRAVRELQQEGLLARRAGVGTFVRAAPRRTSLIDIRDIATEIEERGNRHSMRLIDRQMLEADDALASAFESTSGLPLVHVELVHRERIGRKAGMPVQLEERWVNRRVVPAFEAADLRRVIPTRVLLAAIAPEEIEHTVTAVRPTARERELLELKASEPCLLLRRRSWAQGQVVTLAKLLYPASRYALYGRHQPQN